MAINLFEQLLSKAGEIWSGTKTRDDHDIYIKDASGLSGVAKYLAKQEQAAQPKEPEIHAALSGVEKYLARKQASPAAATVQEVPKTGVAKYLAKQSSGSVPAATPAPVVIPKTGVGKYLAGIPLASTTTKPAASAPEKKQPPQNKPETKKAAASAKKPAPVNAVEVAAPATAGKISAPVVTEKAETVSVAPAGDVIHFENVTQCQSRTVKGTQCKNTNHLTKLQRTINKQKYQFSACPQHHNDTFKPYPPLLETH